MKRGCSVICCRIRACLEMRLVVVYEVGWYNP